MGAGKTATIVGWHLRDEPPVDNYSSFLVTEYGKGASARAPRAIQGKVGVITAAISFSFAPGSRSGSETGFGPPRSMRVKAVKRDIDPPHEFVTIRYTR